MPKNLRKKEIKIRLTDEEHEALLSFSAGRPLASWLRNRGLSTIENGIKKRHRPVPKCDPKILYQVTSIGNNLNQIAKALNSAKYSVEDKTEYLCVLNVIKKDVQKLL